MTLNDQIQKTKKSTRKWNRKTMTNLFSSSCGQKIYLHTRVRLYVHLINYYQASFFTYPISFYSPSDEISHFHTVNKWFSCISKIGYALMQLKTTNWKFCSLNVWISFLPIYSDPMLYSTLLQPAPNCYMHSFSSYLQLPLGRNVTT